MAEGTYNTYKQQRVSRICTELQQINIIIKNDNLIEIWVRYQRGRKKERGRGPRRSGKQHTGHKLGDAEEFSGGFTFGASEVGYLVLSNQGNSSGPHTGT